MGKIWAKSKKNLMEHRMHRWIDAYGEGLGTKDAQVKVKKFSSTKYKAHRRIPESLSIEDMSILGH